MPNGNAGFKKSETIVALGVIAIVGMMILPLPMVLVDFLLVFNLLAAIGLLLFTIYTDRPLSLSSFPTLLLITTLYRLALNISTTRLLLLTGEAGEVIKQFGQFAIGGNPAVGLIIFLILIIVNFMVITKGSERVSEVTARFTLDAMPGKQMAIDADLNAGLISDVDAKARRKEIAREADFYGAMDGASKFVKGDAVAGLIITAVNLIGGLIIGMLQQNMDFARAWSHFSLRTIGDGLISQIPALLISTATGILVTRAATEGGMGSDLQEQLARNPMVAILSGSVLAAMGLMPGLPFLPFFLIGGSVAVLGYIQLRRPVPNQGEEKGEEAPAEVAPDSAVQVSPVDPLEIELGFGLVPLADSNKGGDLLDKVVAVRKSVAGSLGLVVPYIRVRDNLALKPYEYEIKLRGITVSSFEIHSDKLLALDPGDLDEPIPGPATTEPSFGVPATWISPADRQRAELMGYTVVDPTSIIVTHVTEIINQHGWELLGRQEVKRMVDTVKEEHAALIDELTPKHMNLGDIQKVLQNLLRENVPIRDLVLVFETLADHAPLCKDPKSAALDVDQLTEKVRVALGRTIVSHLGLGATIHALSIAMELEQTLLLANKTGQGLDQGTIERMVESIATECQAMTDRGMAPLLVTVPALRPVIRRLAEHACPRLIVLSWAELDPRLKIEGVGVVRA